MMAASCSEAENEALAIFRKDLDAIVDGTASFSFHFQPVVDLRSGAAVGYEALVRFEGALRWSPDRWFQTAEKFGERQALEAVVAGRALEAARLLPPDTFLSLNVGPAFLLSDAWDALLKGYDSFARIVVEITEQEAVADYGAIQRKIEAIRSRGGTVAADDVGSGYASLKHVMELRPDFVKLDRAFVEGCHHDPARAAMIELIGTIAGRLDAWVIAEGVEVQPELEELIRLEVSLGQGYHLGRPAPEMTPVNLERRRAVEEIAKAFAESHTLRRAAETCPVRHDLEAGLRALEQDREEQVSMIVDRWGRPHTLIERHPLHGVRRITSLMKVQVDSAPAEVVQRALARPLSARFDSLIAINGRGEFVGVLRLDRLITLALRDKSDRERSSRAAAMPRLVRH
jgi:EAL domain-containing protein (putative c-di-GMP-specific phosphodiesterase class I)